MPDLDLEVHKTNEGFTALPVHLELKICPEDFTDLSDQPEGCKTVLQTTSKFLSNTEYLQKLLDLWSIDDKTKGVGSKQTSFAKVLAPRRLI